MMSLGNTAIMKSFLIAEKVSNKVIFCLPTDLTPSATSEMVNIYNNFKDATPEKKLDKGKVSSRDGFFYYYKLPSNMFYVGLVDKYYKEDVLYEFVLKIDEFLLRLKEIENGSTEQPITGLNNEQKVFIFRHFEVYRVLNDDGTVDVTNDALERIDVSLFNQKSQLIDENEISMDHSNRNMINKNEYEGEEIFPDENSDKKEEQKLFRKDINELKRVAWWRTMKLVFVSICLVIGVVLFITIPILMKNKQYFNNAFSGNSTATRLLV